MRRVAPVIAVLLIGGALVYGFYFADAPEPLSEDDLAGRVARTRPDWANYTEDLKGYLGATPVAQWAGDPIQATIEGNTVAVTFRLSPPWSEFPFGMPMLLRDPAGQVHDDHSYERLDRTGVYTFVLPNVEGAAWPWVEIKYPPEQQKRLVFGADGTWEANPAP